MGEPHVVEVVVHLIPVRLDLAVGDLDVRGRSLGLLGPVGQPMHFPRSTYLDMLFQKSVDGNFRSKGEVLLQETVVPTVPP